MMLSTKGRYAAMAMVDLARTGSAAPVTLAAIAERQEIPLAYLEQIFARLKREGIVQSVRGPGGGYRLARDPAETTVAAIVLAADESLKMTRCGGMGKPGCMSTKARCLTHELWEALGAHIENYLHSVTLADVCAGKLHPAEVSLIHSAPKGPVELHLV
jgi:Rrf2 family iron-sulfur cluster assembly transcriptional regulator